MQPYTWSVRVHAARPGRATVFARRERFDVGPPLSFDPELECATALEHVLGGIGADLVGCLRTEARRRRVDLDAVEAVVDARLENPLMHLAVVGESGTPALATVDVRVYVSSPAPEDRVRGAWADALARSPMAATLARSGLLRADLVLTP